MWVNNWRYSFLQASLGSAFKLMRKIRTVLRSLSFINDSVQIFKITFARGVKLFEKQKYSAMTVRNRTWYRLHYKCSSVKDSAWSWISQSFSYSYSYLSVWGAISLMASSRLHAKSVIWSAWTVVFWTVLSKTTIARPYWSKPGLYILPVRKFKLS